MTVTPSSPVVGIFKDRSMAEQAIDALHTAEFSSEQVRYSAPGTSGTSGSILADLKSLFTGQNANSGNITNDLTDMGLSNEEAQYYSNEHANGNTILAVLASGREQEALNILHQYGAYNARTSDSSSTTAYSQQPSDYTQQPASSPDDASLQQQNTPAWATQQQPLDSGDYPSQHTPQDVASPDANTAAQELQPDDIPAAQNTAYQPTQPLSPDHNPTPHVTSSPDLATPTSEDHATPSDPVASNSTFEDQVTPVELTVPDSQSTPSDSIESDFTPEPQTPQSDVALSNPTSHATPSDPVASDSTPESQVTSTAPATSEPVDEFQQLQEQLQAAQQQLQDARAQLQAAKDHEAQVQTIKEREQKLQDARQKLQDIQAELQATLAELHETQGRISQY